MTSNEILKADILDILFDNRNKQYGAYALRKNYNNRLSLALAISLSSLLLVFLLSRLHGTTASVKHENDKSEIVIDHVIPPDIKKPEHRIPIRSVPTPVVRERVFVTPVIKEDKLVDNPMPDRSEFLTSLISNINKDGMDASHIPIIKESVPATLKEEPKLSSEFLPFEREPEFPGGQTAWLNFLQKNLIAPDQLEPGDKKMVSIRFHVSAEGTVTSFEIIQSAGKIFDNEVIRVLKKMPKWKPAIQNGQPVSRAFSQPVTFVGVEQ